MEPTTLLIGYTPLAIAALLPVFTIWEASIRRNSRRSWPATLQAVFGVAMLVSAGGAVWISVQTLASYSLVQDRAQDASLVMFAASYVLFALPTVATLIVGLVRPARPLPRRGLTIVVLVTTLVLVSVGGLYSARRLPGALETLLSAV
jgi:drug/metabolite transporter (DMT)-like permease